MATVTLPPPPSTGIRQLDNWLTQAYIVLGQSTNSALLNAANVTGTVDTNHIEPNAIRNTSNNAIVSWADDDATSGRVNIDGPGGIGSDWERFEGRADGTVATLGPYPSTVFTGLDYGKTYYAYYDPATAQYFLTQSYAETLPSSYYFIGAAQANASFGGAGAISGGGQSGAGTTGGASSSASTWGGGGFGTNV